MQARWKNKPNSFGGELMDNSEKNDVSRRDFMKTAIMGIGGLIGAAIGLPAIAYVIGPALQKQTSEWIRLGSAGKVEVNTPTFSSHSSNVGLGSRVSGSR